jgi:hypothetical protein
MSAQSHWVWGAAQLGAGGGQTGDGGGGQLRERRLSLSKAVIEDGQVIAGLDDPTPGEMGQDARSHDLHQVATRRCEWQSSHSKCAKPRESRPQSR